jgi:hypothetical protein
VTGPRCACVRSRSELIDVYSAAFGPPSTTGPMSSYVTNTTCASSLNQADGLGFLDAENSAEVWLALCIETGCAQLTAARVSIPGTGDMPAAWVQVWTSCSRFESLWIRSCVQQQRAGMDQRERRQARCAHADLHFGFRSAWMIAQSLLSPMSSSTALSSSASPNPSVNPPTLAFNIKCTQTRERRAR